MDTMLAVRIPLSGLGCGDARLIERELATVRGVVHVYVNPTLDVAYVDYDPRDADIATLTSTIERAGFRAGPPEA